MVKRIQKNGYLCIPKKIRQQIPSNNVDIQFRDLPDDEGNIVKCIVLVPVGKNKKVVTYYE